jgi:diguanylate cyclase (GGDEF)-like protein
MPTKTKVPAKEHPSTPSGFTGVEPYRLLIDGPDPSALFDSVGHLLAANEAARGEGAPPPASDGPPLTFLLPFWTDDEGRTKVLAGAATDAGLKNLEVRFQVYGEKQERVFWISARRIPGSDDRLVAVAREVSEKSAEMELLKICYEELASQSDRDVTTGFFSRDHFRLLLEREVARADRLSQQLSLIYIDLDNFKTLNDTHGIAAGDEYIYRLAELLRGLLSGGELVGRIAGDEFAAILRDTGAGEAAQQAEKLVASLAALAPVYDGRTLSLTASVGVAAYPEHASGPTELVQAADLAMQQAKRRGGSRARVHDPADKERDRLGTLRDQVDRIRRALAENRFVPVYQPVASIETGRVVAVETLARLQEPDGRLAAPGEFLDAAERFGFVTAIDRLVMAAALDALAVVQRRAFPELELALNLSGHDFEDDALVAHISNLARAKGVRPEKITFEITETAVLRDLARVQHFTRALVAEGFRFALDDFGIGFSSFRYLRELPVATLKFDISYIQNLVVEKENQVFVRGIAGICRDLGIKTVAEGVESSTILSILRDLGVDRAQGHYIGRPSSELPGADRSDVRRRLSPKDLMKDRSTQ